MSTGPKFVQENKDIHITLVSARGVGKTTLLDALRKLDYHVEQLRAEEDVCYDFEPLTEQAIVSKPRRLKP